MEKTLNAEPRTETGKGIARRLRREGRIPAVVYGHEEPHALSVEAREFHREFHTVSESTLIKLKFPDGDREVLIKDYVEDIRTGAITHIDFYEVEKGRKVHTRIALELVGSPVGVREGGVLEHSLYEVEIECLPKDLPEHMTVDVSAWRTVRRSTYRTSLPRRVSSSSTIPSRRSPRSRFHGQPSRTPRTKPRLKSRALSERNLPKRNSPWWLTSLS
jgi:large subunit ribosomal protein L25